MGQIPILTASEKAALHPSLLDPIENRKSGLSLNHIIGCPLDCAYCVRHIFDNFEMKVPRALISDEDAANQLVAHRFFTPHQTPLQLFNRATDPLLPSVFPHTLNVLRLLSERGLRNHLLIITRYKVDRAMADALNAFRPLRLSVLITYSGIDSTAIEPLGWQTAADSLRVAHEAARHYRVILYWRPIIEGLNDSSVHIARAIDLTRTSHATVFTGLFYRTQMQSHYKGNLLPEPYSETARRKILPRATEKLILHAFAAAKVQSLFRKTSCAVAFAHGESDYNGHYGIQEICDICPSQQIARCRLAFTQPTPEAVGEAANRIQARSAFKVDSRAITFDSLAEESRYFIQHLLHYQVHDARHPHLIGRHGRAPIGWSDANPSDD